jgi:2-oxoglutarate dehydrogenase E1 component
VALVRIEQLYPFPKSHVIKFIKDFPSLKKVIWLQEEPANMGAYQKVIFDIINLKSELGLNFDVGYIGRPEKASPATGSAKIHEQELNAILESYFSL